MFTFAADDTSYHEEPVPAALVIPAMREVVTAVQRKILDVTWPRAPDFGEGGVDWSKELGIIESAMALSAGWHDWPTHTVWAPPTVVVGAAQEGGQG